ncbi:hybrid sensor histidine kinase/response regulator [Ideonella sp. YS5]|uniref:hybrid sensor histidine kinase/response regulator n=1 Tax=Ideonella sp. YS5 TaxID=3453714 RepID=UPI003EE99C26
MIDDPQLLAMFRMESEERLAKLDSGLLRLEKNPADHELLEELFREMHSLKGAARMLRLMPIENSTHALEGLLNAARKAQGPLTPAGIEALDSGLVNLRAQIQAVISPAPTAPVPPAMPEPGDMAPAVPAGAESFHIETVRVETAKLDDLLTLTGELGVLQGRSRHTRMLLSGMLEQWSQFERDRRQFPSDRRQETITRLGSLLRAVDDGTREDADRLQSALSGLQEQVLDMRLLPLATVFTLFPRMVHDLGRAAGKEVELHIEGADIALDKRILEEIKDPLMHLLRNAVGHGIEAPEDRLRLGKPRAGQIRLAAIREDRHVNIVVQDDGGGLDLEAIRRSAVQQGVFNAETLEGMSPAQIQQVVFLPGFSTVPYVTELVGRGFGLDAVLTNVEALKGGISLDSTPGRGTAFTLRLPVSLTTQRLLLVVANRQHFGLPVEAVEAIRRLPASACFSLNGRVAIHLDGQSILAPLLAAVLALPGHPGDNAAGSIVCVVVRMDGERLALQVDDVLAEEDVLPRPLPAPLKRVRNVAGLAALANGEICPVLNPADLLRSAAQVAAAVVRPAPRPRRSILLVEDSALVRAMEKRIIEGAGYDVVTAVDGEDAIGKLGSRPFAGVVSDIQMPKLDGLGLTARMREDARYRDLPVILVTALASDADKRRGLEVGANAYIPKPAFDQQLLLETLKRLVGT